MTTKNRSPNFTKDDEGEEVGSTIKKENSKKTSTGGNASQIGDLTARAKKILNVLIAWHNSQARSHRLTGYLLLVISVIFFWYLVADRLTPSTANARVKAYTIAIAPDISGYISRVAVKKNTLVQPGDTLVEIERRRFELIVDQAKASLELSGQSVGANTASVVAATSSIAEAQSKLEEYRLQAKRIFELEQKGIYPKAKGDTARAEVKKAEAQLAAATAERERAKQTLGKEGASNSNIRLATSKLQEAELNLTRTTLVSPSIAIVGSLKIDEGHYAKAGQPLMTLISPDDLWIEAYFTENNLGNITIGDSVDIVFDIYPGQIYKGKVKSFGYGVSDGKPKDLGDLPTVSYKRGWLRDPQRFPVVIEMLDYKPSTDRAGGLRLNSQVDVIVYTSDGFFWNALGKFWIWLVSIFSYLY